MEDFLVDMLNSISDGVDQSVVDKLLQTPAQYSQSLYDIAVAVADTAVKPIAAIVLAIVFTLELARVSVKADGDRELGVRMIGLLMLKMVLVLIAAQNADLFLRAIDQIGEAVMGGITQVAPSTGGAGSGGLGDQMKDAIEDTGWTGKIAAMILLVLPFLASKLAAITCTIVIMLRFVQIYMLTAFNPLPIAFMACDETRQMGIGYLKAYAAAILQCATLWLGIVMYRAMAADSVNVDDYHDGDGLSGWIVGQFGNLLLASVLLIGVVVVSTSVAKRWLGSEA